MFGTLSRRVLGLTVLFVMLAEVLIFVPSVARFRVDYLQNRLERSQIASLALLAHPEGRVPSELEQELLRNAGVLNIVLRRDSIRQLMLASDMPKPIEATFDLRDPPYWTLLRDAIACMWPRENRVVRVIGIPTNGAGVEIEITLWEHDLGAALLDYALRILYLSLFISSLAGALLFLAVRRGIVGPIDRVVTHIKAYQHAPQDRRRIIAPEARIRELREAEEALAEMQTELSDALRQNERLAGLGGALAKISHDLRNMLTTGQLLADRMERVEDPTVKRIAPKIVAAMSRAIALCERTLTYGKAEEPPPQIAPVDVAALVAEVRESIGLNGEVALAADIPAGLTLPADREQLFRVLSNLIRNAAEAIAGTGRPGTVTVSARAEDGGGTIRILDDGPGLPESARANLFQPFRGGARRGGTGLGLAIAAELVRNHGGRLRLVGTSAAGTEFAIELPAPPR